jgi:hypothetical protein
MITALKHAKLLATTEYIRNADRAILNTDRAILNTDRAILNTDRAILNTDRAILNTDRAILNTDRAILNTVFRNTFQRVNKCLETGGDTLNVTCNFLYCNQQVH